MALNFPEIFLPQQLRAALRHEAALAGQGVDKSLVFQLVIGAFGGDDADAQILGQRPYAGQRLALGHLSGQDGVLDLAVDLVVDGRAAAVVDV